MGDFSRQCHRMIHSACKNVLCLRWEASRRCLVIFSQLSYFIITLSIQSATFDVCTFNLSDIILDKTFFRFNYGHLVPTSPYLYTLFKVTNKYFKTFISLCENLLTYAYPHSTHSIFRASEPSPEPKMPIRSLQQLDFGRITFPAVYVSSSPICLYFPRGLSHLYLSGGTQDEVLGRCRFLFMCKT